MARCKARADGLGDCDGCFIGRPEWCQAKGGIPKDKHEYVRQQLIEIFSPPTVKRRAERKGVES